MWNEIGKTNNKFITSRSFLSSDIMPTSWKKKATNYRIYGLVTRYGPQFFFFFFSSFFRPRLFIHSSSVGNSAAGRLEMIFQFCRILILQFEHENSDRRSSTINSTIWLLRAKLFLSLGRFLRIDRNEIRRRARILAIETFPRNSIRPTGSPVPRAIGTKQSRQKENSREILPKNRLDVTAV